MKPTSLQHPYSLLLPFSNNSNNYTIIVLLDGTENPLKAETLSCPFLYLKHNALVEVFNESLSE